MRLLVVESDRPLAAFLRRSLEAERYAVECVEEGVEAGRRMRDGAPDLVLCDVSNADGEALAALRGSSGSAPVLALVAGEDVEERVRCLDGGADDCLAKPFSYRELSARVRALLRRSGRQAQSVLRAGDLELDRFARMVHRGGRAVELTAREFLLLEYLMRQGGRCATRAELLEHVWGLHFDPKTNVVDVYINYLRRKIDAGASERLIHTVRGRGYRIGPAAVE